MADIYLAHGGTVGVSEQAARKHILFTNTIDFSGTHLVSGVATSNALTATDIGQLINIPAGFFMHTFGVRLDTVQGAVATCVFGDAVDPNGWAAGAPFDLDGTALDTAFSLPGDAYPALGGKLYHVADTIDIDPGHVVDTAVITVFAAGYMID
ncbi:MAG: hypothetical protein GY774_10670 [Planctomycetes bacterium]|nr:hypothetical protein [Planctomycetota bacterium]